MSQARRDSWLSREFLGARTPVRSVAGRRKSSPTNHTRRVQHDMKFRPVLGQIAGLSTSFQDIYHSGN